MKRDLMLCCALLFALIMGTPATAQDDVRWRLTISEDLRDVVGSGYTFGGATLSPSGARVAWLELENGLCVYDFAANTTNCNPLPWDESFLSGLPPRFSERSEITWSPDENAIAFHEPLLLGADADLWLFSPSSETFANLTDDQATYIFDTSETSGFSGAAMDYAPVWSLESNSLFFFRVVLESQDERSIGLYEITAAGGDAELVSEFPAEISVSTAVLSPDGTQLAVVAIDGIEGNSGDGIWLINVSDGTIEPIATGDVFLAGMTEWVDITNVTDVIWRGESVIVTVVGAAIVEDGTTQSNRVIQNYYHVDTTTGDVTALADLSALQVDDLQNNQAYSMPRAGILADDGQTFFYIHYEGNRHRANLSGVSLDDFGTQLESVTFDYILSNGSSLYVLSDNGRVLVNERTLLTFERGG